MPQYHNDEFLVSYMHEYDADLDLDQHRNNSMTELLYNAEPVLS